MRIHAGAFSDISTCTCAAIGDGVAVVLRVKDEVVAFQNQCLHQASPLDGGLAAGGLLICPLHFWQYEVPSGTHVGSEARLQRFPVEIIDGEVWVDVPEPEPQRSMRDVLLQHAETWDRTTTSPSVASRSINAVVWDMGGILYRHFTEPTVEYGQRNGWPLEELAMGPMGKRADPAYTAMVQGDISEGEYFRGVIDQLTARGISFDPVTAIDWSTELRDDVWDAIDDIAGSEIRQAILTNDGSKFLGDSWWTTWEFKDKFDAIVDVKTLNVRKPHPDAYGAVVAAMDLEPQTALFVDDMPVNCAGAEAVGLQSLLFDITNPSASVEKLRARLSLH